MHLPYGTPKPAEKTRYAALEEAHLAARWYRSVRPAKGEGYTLILLRSGRSQLSLRVELVPPDTDGIPESQAPADCPRLDELQERCRDPNARKFWSGGVPNPDAL